MVFRRRKFAKRTRRFRRRFRRKSFRKGKGDGVRYFKLRTALDFAADAGGSINYTWSLTAISTSLVNINGAGPTNSLEDVAAVGNLFDNYMVKAVKFKFIPQLPNDTSTATGFYPLYIILDRDTPNTTPPIGSIATAVAYENMKVVNMYKPWTYYRRVPKFIQNTMPYGGWLDLAAIPNYGCVEMYGLGFDVSQNYGKIIATYYLACKNRR